MNTQSSNSGPNIGRTRRTNFRGKLKQIKTKIKFSPEQLTQAKQNIQKFEEFCTQNGVDKTTINQAITALKKFEISRQKPEGLTISITENKKTSFFGGSSAKPSTISAKTDKSLVADLKEKGAIPEDKIDEAVEKNGTINLGKLRNYLTNADQQKLCNYNMNVLLARPPSAEAIKDANEKLKEYQGKTLDIKSLPPATQAALQKKDNSVSMTLRYGTEVGADKINAIKNLKNVQQTVQLLAEKTEPIELSDLMSLNQSINKGTSANGGPIDELRDCDIYAAREELQYCPQIYVKQAMEKFVYWLNEGIEECRTGVKSETEDSPSGCYGNPILLAGKAHERLVSLHPFSDGNGRASRSVIQMICQKFDLPPFTGDGDDPMFFQNACFGRVGEYPEKVKMGYVIDYVPNPDRHIQFMLAGFNNTISIVKK